ncbi:MAG: acyl-[acyl-carrier-protein] thioesterase [Thermodesulfobacteriota bacterium]
MTFQQTRKIDYFQTATDGRIKLDALVRILQNAALDHVHEADRDAQVIIAAGYAWILNKVIIDISRYPVYGETVTVNTWHRGIRGFKSYREYEILAGGQRVATAASSWLFLDLARRRVVKVPKETDELYGVVPALALGRDIETWKPDKNLVPPESMEIITRRSDYDMLGHVNNAVYFDYLDTLIGNTLGDGFGVRTIAIQYNREISRDVKRIQAGLVKRENGACAYTIFDGSGVYACGDIVLA